MKLLTRRTAALLLALAHPAIAAAACDSEPGPKVIWIACDKRGADLRGVDLRGAILTRSNLEDADLRDALLTGTEFNFANLKRARLAAKRRSTRPR